MQVPLAHWLSIVQVAPGARLHTPVVLHCVPPLSLQVVNCAASLKPQVLVVHVGV